MKNQSIYISLLFIIIAGVLGWYIMRRPVVVDPSNDVIPSGGVSATFNCDDGKSIMAVFHVPEDKNIDITLSDGRSMSLPHALSADGARYANADESFVFWNRGNTAFVQEGDATTYSNCVEAQEPTN